MTNIFIDKNDLIALRDDIDYLLQKGKQSFAVDVQQRIYESDDLNEKEQLVIKILNKKPGINKEEVVNLQDRYARITILHTLDGLIKKGLIISKRDKIKKRTYRLYVNYQNITYSVKEDLDAFKVYYCELLDNAVPIAKKLWLNSKKGGERFLEFYNLLRVSIGPYKYLCTMYITSDIFLWNERPLDDDTLHRKFALFFKTAKEIHDKLVKVWSASLSRLQRKYMIN